MDEIISPHVGVALGDRFLQLVERDAVPHQPFGVGLNLKPFDCAAGTDDVDNAGDASKLTFEHPVLFGLEIVERINVVSGGVHRAPQSVPQNFAGGALWRNAGNDAVGQSIDELQPVDDFLTRFVEVDAVFELVPQVRQAEQ